MKKDYIRDYATEAFRFYASIGMNSDEYREKLRREAMETIARREGSTKSDGSPTEAMLMHAEKVIEGKISVLEELEAVEKTLKEFEARPYYNMLIIPLIRKVYFTEPNKPLKKGDIQDRVIKACEELNIVERTAYRYLKKARDVFAYNRKLRTEK